MIMSEGEIYFIWAICGKVLVSLSGKGMKQEIAQLQSLRILPYHMDSEQKFRETRDDRKGQIGVKRKRTVNFASS